MASLTEYRRKRNFRTTPEPAGKPHRSIQKPLTFVVQKHDASRLHYDFRLELAGVLKSWAVPKGPSLDPAQKRLAVEVEDHPLEYGSFEGVIPAGQYGGGTVLLWDQGTWSPIDDPEQGLRAGKLKFELHGQKLRGQWMLVRSGSRKSKQPEWLLFKIKDEAARPEREYRLIEEEPLSIISGRDLPEIAADKDRVWKSKSAATKGNPQSKSATGRATNGSAPQHTSAPGSDRKPAAKSHERRRQAAARLPQTILVELPTLVQSAPTGDDWLHEIKLDGYRMICRVENGDVHFITRNQLDWTAKVSSLVKAMAKLKVRQAVFDGEVVALDEHGLTDFQLLQNAFREHDRSSLVYMVFDLLFLDGVDLRDQPLIERRAALAALKLPTSSGQVRFVEHFAGQGDKVFEHACNAGFEGIISKRLDRSYRAGRGMDWVKTKCQQHAEFVIGGYTDPTGSRRHLGALLLGYYEGKELRYAGRVGSGFSDDTLDDLFRHLKLLRRSDSPFVDLPAKGRTTAGVHWVEPQLVAQVKFSNWTQDDLLRQAVFQGLRADKPAGKVTRERPAKLNTNGRPRAAQSRKRSTPSPERAVPSHESKNVNMKPRRTATVRAASAAKNKNSETAIQGVRLTSPDKVLWPDEGLTKRELAEYYAAIGKWMLPYAAGRPLALVRCPDGMAGPRFFQKHPGQAVPDELRRVSLQEKAGRDTYLVAENVAGLIALAQISALEIHVWNSRIDAVESPDQFVLDLDPDPSVPWAGVIQAALELREFLLELALVSFVKTSGGKGLHLVVPLRRDHDWKTVRDFSEQIARAAERAAPDRYTSNMAKRARAGRIFIDYLRNQRGATSIAPFSPRARAGAPVAVPVSWRELRHVESADQFTLRTVLARLRSQRRDPWEEMRGLKQRLTKAMVAKLGG